MTAITALGRIAIIDKGHILLAHQIGADNTFLPGGHVEPNESVKYTILRELKEEFNGDGRISQFLGVIEHGFQRNDQPHYALNLVFSGTLLNYTFPQPIKSLETHLEFYWQPIQKMDEENLLPSPLVSMIVEYYKHDQKSVWMNTD